MVSISFLVFWSFWPGFLMAYMTSDSAGSLHSSWRLDFWCIAWPLVQRGVLPELGDRTCWWGWDWGLEIVLGSTERIENRGSTQVGPQSRILVWSLVQEKVYAWICLSVLLASVVCFSGWCGLHLAVDICPKVGVVPWKWVWGRKRLLNSNRNHGRISRKASSKRTKNINEFYRNTIQHSKNTV